MSRATGPAGASANAGSIAPPAVSADGRFVAFWSNATNLSPDDSDTLYDLYRRDLASDTTVLVSRASGKFGPKAAGAFYFGGPRMSGDGRLVAFMADAANLSPDDKDALGDIYVRDLDANETILASRASGADGVKANEVLVPARHLGRRPVRGVRLGGDEPDRGSADRRAGVRPRPGDEHDHARVARDGSRRRARRQRRQSPGDLGRRPVRGVHHAQRTGPGRPQRSSSTSTSATGAQRRPRSCRAPRASSAPSLDADSRATAISADGRAITFFTRAQLSPDDGGSNFDVYVRNLATSTTTLVSRATGAAGARGDADSRLSAISGDGRLVAFSSPATNLSAADIDPELDVFVRDTVANTTTLVSRASGAGGAAGDDTSFGAAISADGRVVAFGSHATNLSAADPLGDADTYVRELRAQFPPPLGGARAAAAAAGKREPYPPARLWYRVSVEFKGRKVFTDRVSGLPDPRTRTGSSRAGTRSG